MVDEVEGACEGGGDDQADAEWFDGFDEEVSVVHDVFIFYGRPVNWERKAAMVVTRLMSSMSAGGCLNCCLRFAKWPADGVGSAQIWGIWGMGCDEGRWCFSCYTVGIGSLEIKTLKLILSLVV